MKRIISVLFAAIFVFGLAATAFAIHAEIPAETQAVVAAGTTQITISGDIRVRGWLLHDINSARTPAGSEAGTGNGASYYDQRVRLAVDGTMGNVSGRIHLESGNDANDVYIWGVGQDKSGTFESKPSSVSILEAWIQYKGEGLFGFPAGFKVGHMPIALGAVPLFFDHTKFGDDAILAFADPTPNTHVVLADIKVMENSGHLGGTQGSAVLFAPAFPLAGNLFDSNSYNIDAYAAVLAHKIASTNLMAYYVYINDPALGTGLQDASLSAKGDVQGLTYTVQGDYQFGTIGKAAPLGSPYDLKADSYALWAQVGYRIDPVGVRVAVAKGSGEVQSLGDKNVNEFINFLGSNRYYTVVYDYQLAGSNFNRYQGISNTQMVNAGIDLKPMNKMNLSIDGYFLRASDTLTGASKDLGWEADLKGSYALAKNLTYFVNAGQLWTGHFYRDFEGTRKNPSVVMHGLELAF